MNRLQKPQTYLYSQLKLDSARLDFASDPAALFETEESLEAIDASVNALKGAISNLDVRHREALLARYDLHPGRLTVNELSRNWGVSRQRVYYLASRACHTVRRALGVTGPIHRN